MKMRVLSWAIATWTELNYSYNSPPFTSQMSFASANVACAWHVSGFPGENPGQPVSQQQRTACNSESTAFFFQSIAISRFISSSATYNPIERYWGIQKICQQQSHVRPVETSTTPQGTACVEKYSVNDKCGIGIFTHGVCFTTACVQTIKLSHEIPAYIEA